VNRVNEKRDVTTKDKTMKIKIEPTATSLTIGDDYRDKNTIKFKIVLEGKDDVWLKLQIPLGSNGVLRQPEDANSVEIYYTAGNNPREPASVISPDEDKVEDTRKWWLGDSQDGVQVGGNAELTVSITNILCRADAGGCEIAVEWQTGMESGTAPIAITKAKPAAPHSSILYFIAEPTSLIGNGTVKLYWDIVGDQPATLITRSGTREDVKSPLEETLSKTYAFTLKVGSEEKQVTVNVLAEDQWHGIPLSDDKFPSVIFRSQTTDDALYALCISTGKAGEKATLYKSADGITNWQAVSDALPDGMESSPGLRLGGRLWLIGGSAVDPEQKSDRICYYDLKDHRWHDATLTYSDPKLKFEERMGHACVSPDDNTIWVLGGLGEFNCLNDVWSFTLDPKNPSQLRASRLFESSGWSPRCMFSAVFFKGMIWVLGGVDSPNGNPVGDIWAATPSSKKWEKRPLKADGNYVVANSIASGADASGGTLFAVVKNPQTPAKLQKLISSAVTSTLDNWEEGPSGFHSTPENWMLTPHSITVAGFRNRLYLRYLHRNSLYGVPARDGRPAAPLYVYID
jgi:hypothetical protein